MLFSVPLKKDASGLVDKRVNYGAMRPGFNTPVGRKLFRICENWIGGLCLGLCLGDGFCHFFIEIQINLLEMLPPIFWSSSYTVVCL